jgi:hypothetical protein
VTYCERHKIVLLGKGRLCNQCPDVPGNVVNADDDQLPADPLACVHDFQPEVIGGTLLTNHVVCRFCSHREEMSEDEINARHDYPKQYQIHEEPDTAVPSHAQLETVQHEVRTEIKRTMTLVARTKKTLRDGESNVAAWVRVLPWGLGEAATALEFFVECLQ